MVSTEVSEQGVGAVMVSQQTAFLTESGLEADDNRVAAGLHQVAITHQAHQVHQDMILLNNFDCIYLNNNAEWTSQLKLKTLFAWYDDLDLNQLWIAEDNLMELQELSSARQTAVTELTTCFGEDLPASLPGWEIANILPWNIFAIGILRLGGGVAAASSTVSSLPTASDCSAQVRRPNTPPI